MFRSLWREPGRLRGLPVMVGIVFTPGRRCNPIISLRLSNGKDGEIPGLFPVTPLSRHVTTPMMKMWKQQGPDWRDDNGDLDPGGCDGGALRRDRRGEPERGAARGAVVRSPHPVAHPCPHQTTH